MIVLGAGGVLEAGEDVGQVLPELLVEDEAQVLESLHLHGLQVARALPHILVCRHRALGPRHYHGWLLLLIIGAPRRLLLLLISLPSANNIYELLAVFFFFTSANWVGIMETYIPAGASCSWSGSACPACCASA
jgi:hypothetical protein